jgi:hypothetical protein
MGCSEAARSCERGELELLRAGPQLRPRSHPGEPRHHRSIGADGGGASLGGAYLAASSENSPAARAALGESVSLSSVGSDPGYYKALIGRARRPSVRARSATVINAEAEACCEHQVSSHRVAENREQGNRGKHQPASTEIPLDHGRGAAAGSSAEAGAESRS